MEPSSATTASSDFPARDTGPAPLSSLVGYLGRATHRFISSAFGAGAFALIIFGVVLTKFRLARDVTGPAIRQELVRTGVQVIPMFLFLSCAMGMLVIGQAIAKLNQVGAASILGPIMVTAIIRELGPLLTAMLVLSRSGVRNVIELGTTRALGELEALEALRIDPIHYLVVPRVFGMALAVFALTVYFIIGSLASGYLFAFLNGVPLRPSDFYYQLSDSLTFLDFAALAIKSLLFGLIIAIVTCYHGLAQPLRLGQISGVTILAVAQCVVACVLVDAFFLVLFLLV